MDSAILKRRKLRFIFILFIIIFLEFCASYNIHAQLFRVDAFFEDGFDLDSGLWAFNGIAYRDPIENYIVLTNTQQSSWGHIWLDYQVEGPFTVSFRYIKQEEELGQTA